MNGILVDGLSVTTAQSGSDVEIVLDRTPFYAEGGGQLADGGRIVLSNGAVVEIDDVQAPVTGLSVHRGRVISGEVLVGDKGLATIDQERRDGISRAHTATHMVHKAFREILGETATQAGSENSPGRFRFDFPSTGAVSESVLNDVEARVNTLLLDNLEVSAEVMSQDEAKKIGAMALFGEKYGETVRVQSIGSSKELCGGTHTRATGEIGLFRILAESAISAGVRRIEAVTGSTALVVIDKAEQRLAAVCEVVKGTADNVADKVASLRSDNRELEKEIARLKQKLASSAGGDLTSAAVEVEGIKVLAASVDGADAKSLRDTLDQCKNKLGSGVILLAAVTDGKVALTAGVTKDLTDRVKAGDLMRDVAQQLGGKGGGRGGGGVGPSPRAVGAGGTPRPPRVKASTSKPA